MALRKIDFGAELGKGWKLFQANMGVLVLATVILGVVSAVTLWILVAPLIVGMFLLIRRLLKNDTVKPQAGDIFKGLECFGQAFLLVVLGFVASCVLGWIPVVGQLVGMVIGSVTMWAFMFIAYQKLSAIDAIKKVIEHTKNGEFTMPLLFAVVASIIGGLGVIVCGVGAFFTLPIAYCMMACCYETLFGDEPEVIDPISIEPPSPPLQ